MVWTCMCPALNHPSGPTHKDAQEIVFERGENNKNPKQPTALGFKEICSNPKLESLTVRDW